MGIFGRSGQAARGEGAGTGTPAGRLVVAELARRGFTARQTDEATVTDSLGRAFVLTRLVDALDQADADAHERVASSWVDAMLAAFDAPAADAEELRERVLLRVVPGRSLAPGIREPLSLAPDLAIVPALDLPRHVETIGDPESMGGWDELWPRGRQNLLELPGASTGPFQGRSLIRCGPEQSVAVHWFAFADWFGASRILVLDEILHRELGPDAHAPYGTLVALPDRSTILVHIITGPELEPVYDVMTQAAAEAQKRPANGPVSPWVYYRTVTAPLQPVAIRSGTGIAVYQNNEPFRGLLDDFARED